MLFNPHFYQYKKQTNIITFKTTDNVDQYAVNHRCFFSLHVVDHTPAVGREFCVFGRQKVLPTSRALRRAFKAARLTTWARSPADRQGCGGKCRHVMPTMADCSDSHRSLLWRLDVFACRLRFCIVMWRVCDLPFCVVKVSSYAIWIRCAAGQGFSGTPWKIWTVFHLDANV